MLLSLIVYATAVSLLLGLAAWTLERAVRALAFPTRWIWAGAMSGSLGFTLVAILWPTASSTPQAPASATPLDAILVPVVESLTRLADPLPSGVGLDTLLGAGWAMLSLVAASVLMGAHLRLVLERPAWSPEKLGGRDVLVSDDLGPGVVGWLRSAIVMPRWAMGMHPREQELMLRHEMEHCKAGDAPLIGAALLLRILLPWNVPLWWHVHRLRAAIEIDCDRRVVHRSADLKRYAALLVEIGARRTASRWSALAFARPIPLIERRILAMTDTRDPRYMRMAGLTLVALLLVVASCQVEQVSINIEVEQVTPDARGQMTPDARAEAIGRAARILRARIEEFRVEEPLIQEFPRTTDPPAPQGQQEILRLTGEQVSEEEILSRLAASGLTRAQVRSQLSSMGIDPSIADAYFDRLEQESAPDAPADAIDRADRILDQSASLEFKLILPVSELAPALSRIDRQIVRILGVDSIRELGRHIEDPSRNIQDLIFGGQTANSAQADSTGVDQEAEDPADNLRPFTSLLASGDMEGVYLVTTEDVEVATLFLAIPEVQTALPRNVSLHWEADLVGLGQTTYRRLIVTEEDAFVTGDMLESARARRGPQSDRTQVALRFNRAGGRAFSDFTSQHIGDHIAIILDDEIVSTPVIRDRIGANGVINVGNSAPPRR